MHFNKNFVRKGFLSAELMIVIVIMIVLLAVAAPGGISLLNTGKESTARSDTALIGTAISQYKMEMGSYPASLNVLTTTPGNGYGPWLTKLSVDPWGNSYQYLNSDTAFVIYSWGPNGKNNGTVITKIAGDDIGFIGK